MWITNTIVYLYIDQTYITVDDFNQGQVIRVVCSCHGMMCLVLCSMRF